MKAHDELVLAPLEVRDLPLGGGLVIHRLVCASEICGGSICTLALEEQLAGALQAEI
jgi:hypothetical protein